MVSTVWQGLLFLVCFLTWYTQMFHVWDHFDHTNDVAWWKEQGWPLIKVCMRRCQEVHIAAIITIYDIHREWQVSTSTNSSQTSISTTLLSSSIPVTPLSKCLLPWVWINLNNGCPQFLTLPLTRMCTCPTSHLATVERCRERICGFWGHW